jgi:hypothetical protein
MAAPPPPNRASAYQRIILDHEGQLQTWLREFDRSGALPEAHAAVDNAYALGHAAGLEIGRAEHIDGVRTLLLNLIELKFGEVDDGAILDRIDEAQLPRLQRWILAVLGAESVHEVITH